MSTTHANYAAQSYTRNLGKGVLTSGWRVMRGDDVVCDCYGGQDRAGRIADHLNATEALDAPPATTSTSPRLPQLDVEAQAVLLGTLRLLDLQLAQPPSPEMLAVMRRQIRCALADHAAGREHLCEQLATGAYRRAYSA